MDPGTPFLQIAMAIVKEVSPKINSSMAGSVENVLKQFINRIITFDQCKEFIFPIIKSTSPVEKLNAILQIYSPPLPSVGIQNNSKNLELRPYRNRNSTWSDEEDSFLFEAVRRYGTNDWRLISSYVGNGKFAPQCSQRWNRGINPKISKLPWSNDDDSKLLSLVDIHGARSWSKIATLMQNRSDVQCRYRYKHLTKTNKACSCAYSPPEYKQFEENIFGFFNPIGQTFF